MKAKKIIVLLTAMCMLFGLVACGKSADTNVNDGQNVVDENNVGDAEEGNAGETGNYDEITEEVVRNHAVTDASDFEYSVNEYTGEVSISDYTGKDAIVVFPEEIDGAPVTSISSYFFANDTHTHVRGVFIPANIKELYATFANNSTVEVVVLEGTEILGDSFCHNSSALHTIVLPDTLKEIGKFSISSQNIKEIYIPESVESIDELAFGAPYDLTIKGKAGSYVQTYYETYWLSNESTYRCTFEAVD